MFLLWMKPARVTARRLPALLLTVTTPTTNHLTVLTSYVTLPPNQVEVRRWLNLLCNCPFPSRPPGVVAAQGPVVSAPRAGGPACPTGRADRTGPHIPSMSRCAPCPPSAA